MSGRRKKGSKKKGGDGKDKHGSDTTRISSSSVDLYSKTSKKKTKPHGTDQLQSSIFFGYDLPDDITEEEILSFLEGFQQSIIKVEVVLDEKCGTYAKVTFATHSDAQAAMQQYSNQPWYDIGVNVTLKPWKDRKEFSLPPKKHASFPSMSGSRKKAKSTAVAFKHSSMFFGYDLPDDVTEDDILSFLEEYEQSIVSIEVELNEKHGNYARVTFETSTDAQEAMMYYSGQYWHEFDVRVVMKPWKEKERPQKGKKQQQQHSKHIYDEDDDNFSTCSESTRQSEACSRKDSYFLLPYPGSNDSKAGKPICSEKSTEPKQQEKKLTGSGGSRKVEYTVKISGFSFDVKEKDILKLVKPFGDLTSPVRIASYPQNRICYAYVNYCSSSSARAAVAQLDRSEFDNTRIHVCHRGKLGVDHSCRKKLQELAKEEYDDTTIDVGSVEQVQDAGAASSMSIGKMHLKPLTNSPRHDISGVDSSPCRSDGSHKGSLAKCDSLSESFEKSPDSCSPHTEQQQTTKKSRNMASYASVAKSPPKPVEKVSSGKKRSQGVGKKAINPPEKSKADQSSKYHSDPKPCTIQTKQIVSNIDNLPDTGPTKKQATNVSVDTLPECVKVLFDTHLLTQKPEFYTDAIHTSINKSNVKNYLQEHQAPNGAEESSRNPNIPPIISPHKEPVRGAISHSFATQSSSQGVKIVQDSRPDSASRQQPKFDSGVMRSNCILEVTNLHPNASVQDLDRYFKPYGALQAPISIRPHPVSDSCSAIVHYMSADAAQNAMRRLNGCDISGYQMHIVNVNDEDAGMEIPADMAPVVSDSNDSSLVVSSNLPTPVKKTVENNTTLSVQKVGFPIIKSMSKNLQRFLKEQLSNKITELNQLGGNIEWSDNSVIVSGADQSVLNNFDNDVLCLLEETTEHLFADQWNKLMHVDCDDTSFLSQFIEEFSDDVKIDLDYANKSITFVGKEQMVLKVKHKLFKKTCQDLSMLGYQMLVLITCIPNLVRDIETDWNVTVTGFVEGSTCLYFKGDSIQMAYKYVMERIGFCRSKEFPCCNIDISLVTVAIAYIKKVGIAVVICNTSGERLVLNARILSTDILVVYSLSVKEIDRAICVLESSPHKKEVELPSKDMLAKLQESFEELQGAYTVSLRPSASSVVIQGYEKKYVNVVYGKLKKLIDDFTVRTVEFKASKEKTQFLKHIMFDNPTEKAKTLLSSLSSSMSLKVQNGPVTLTLTGSLGAIEEGIKRIERELLENFQVDSFYTRCHPDFLSQIEKYVKEPLEKELNVIVYYFPVHGTERLEPPREVSAFIEVCSVDSADFEKARKVLAKLDPKSHLFLMDGEELKCIESACEDGTIDLHQIGDPYRIRIQLRHYQGTIVMHGFTRKEAEDCLQSLRQQMSIVVHIDLTTLQLEYIKMKKQDVLKLCKATVETFQGAPPKLKLEGMKSQIERSKRVLQKVLNGIVSRSHKQTHSKYILMWKKCWQELNDKICQDKELHVELSTSVSDGSITCELTVVGNDELKVESAISSVRKIDGSFKECVVSTDTMGVKMLNEGLKLGNLKVRKTLIYHIEVATSITIVSPYSMQAEEVHKTVEEFISTEREKRKITKKLFPLKYSFLAKQLKSDWSKVQEIARSNKILGINLVTDPCCGIEVKGTEVAIKHAGPQILQHILSLESDLSSSVIPVDCYSRSALTSTELLQLCKELENELSISLTVQVCPEVLSSAIVQLNNSSVKVEICEGSICLDDSEVIVNFTDVTLTVHQELKAVIGESAIIDCEHHIECCGPQSPGKAINFYKFDDKNPMVIHAVMPNWINENSDESDLIGAAITKSLNLAAECDVTSISLPYLSCVGKDLSVEFLANACLPAVYDFCKQSTSIKKVRFVLPNNMAEKFKNEFTTGLFKQWIVAEESNSRSPTPDDTLVSSTSVESIWLWKDDDGKYYRYQATENNILNQESAVSSTCSLRIGKFTYTIDFIAMTQTNTSTRRVRSIKKITNNHVWLYKNNLQKWERFSLKDSIKIEIMRVTGTRDTHVVNGNVCSYDFDDMIQLNHHNSKKTDIKRTAISVPSIKSEDKQDGSGESKVLVFGLSADVTTANEKVKDCIKSLSVVKCIDIKAKLVPLLDRHINQIQKDYRVEINSLPSSEFNDSSDTKAKYNVTGYKTCVQEAITAVYRILTSSSAPSEVQSFARPTEWEPQSDSIELKDVSQGSSEWKKILHRMQETIPNVNLVSIKRIQNEFLWEKYCQHKERMSRKGPERINEMELFHGTRSNPPEDIYMSEEGFDMRFSRAGMWGQGNYFAESAQYSCGYTYTKQDTHSYKSFYGGMWTSKTVRQMFLVKVLTGDSYTSPSNNTLRMPPYKPSTSSEKVRYDTVNGVTQGSKVYITYSNDKAYPLYLISFT